MEEWELVDIAAKCKALLLSLCTCRVHPCAARYPINLFYVLAYATDMAYITAPGHVETPKSFRRRLYNTLHTMATAVMDIRVTKLKPVFNWPQVWRNLQAVWITEDVKSIWYTAIHDIIPTNEHLSKIHLTDSNRCTHCGQSDTLLHRITECNEGKDIWEWTRARLSMILRTNTINIPAEWTLRPHFHIWPPQRHGAILWILAHLVHFHTKQRQPTPMECADFMRRARWKHITCHTA